MSLEAIERARRSFLADVYSMRDDFALKYREKLRSIAFEHDYQRRFPVEVVQLAQAEVRKRIEAARTNIAAALDAGWRPTSLASINTMLSWFFSPERHDEHLSSDLYAFVVSSFSDVGRHDPEGETRHKLQLGHAESRACEGAVESLELIAVAKYGSYRQVEYNDEFRRRVLQALCEHFTTGSGETLFVRRLADLLGVEHNLGNYRAIGNSVQYWGQKGALGILADRSLQSEFPDVGVTEITAYGVDLLDGRHDARAPAVHHSYQITNSTIGVAGSMSGGTVNQSVGIGLTGLAAALEALRDEIVDSAIPTASVIELTALEAARLSREENRDEGKLRKVLQGLSQVVQTLAAVPAAWSFVLDEAVKAGYLSPPPVC
jgi:hypothetical protein